jgi:hypothetical protein
MATLRRGSVLRNLKIDDVSSVDRGAGRGVRVVLTQRGERRPLATTYISKLECSPSGVVTVVEADGTVHVFEPKEAKMTSVEKAAQPAADISRRTRATIEAIADLTQQRNPTMSRAEALQKAVCSPEVSALHQQERLQKLGF